MSSGWLWTCFVLMYFMTVYKKSRSSSFSHYLFFNSSQKSQLQKSRFCVMLLFVFTTAICLALHTFAAPAADLDRRQNGSACKKIHFIFARGSTESGTLGITVGPAFSKALNTKFGANNVASEGVPYPADIAGAFSGGTNPSGSAGAVKMTAMAKSVISRCPSAKIVLGGYSQGAEQVHGALAATNLGADGAKIAVRCYLISDPHTGF
jgi:hypothetical protein